MSTETPPPWDTDPLSRYFAEAEYNDRVTAFSFPTVFALLQAANSALELVEKAVEHDGEQVLLIPRFLIVRFRSSYLASIRLAMSGQIPESFALLRSAIEQAWYALHIARDPNPTSRAEIWLKRNDGPSEKAACKKEFTVKNVRTTHEACDQATADQLREVYETSIDFGAHPNQMGMLISMAHEKNPNQINYEVGILHPDTVPMLGALRLSVAVVIGALKIFQLVYPAKLAATPVQDRIGQLIKDINSVFKPWAGQI